MTDRAALAARHHEATDIDPKWCDCGHLWPCDTARALALPPDPELLAQAMRVWFGEVLLNPKKAAAGVIAAWPDD